MRWLKLHLHTNSTKRGIVVLLVPGGPDFSESECGKLIREIRGRLHWTQEELARRSGLSPATIKFAETGRYRPSWNTMSSLKKVPEFESELFSLLNEGKDKPFSVHPTRDYSANALLQQTRHLLHRNGSRLPDEFFLLEDSDIKNLVAVTRNNPNGVIIETLRQSLASLLTQHAQIFREFAKDKRLHICSITSGYGWLEAVLCQALTSQGMCREIKLSIMHSSIKLLNFGYDTLTPQFRGESSINTSYHLGHFDSLISLQSVLQSFRKPNEQVLVFLPSLLYNYDESKRLIMNISNLTQEGDFLLFNFVEASLDEKNPKHITQVDFRFNQNYLISDDPEYQSMINTSLNSMIGGIGEIEYTPKILLHPERYGSLALYAVNLGIKVHYQNKASKEFSGYRIYRHKAQSVINELEAFGWSVVAMSNFQIDTYMALQQKWTLFIRK